MTRLITYQFENKKAGQSWTKKEKLVYVQYRTVHNLGNKTVCAVVNLLKSNLYTYIKYRSLCIR